MKGSTGTHFEAHIVVQTGTNDYISMGPSMGNQMATSEEGKQFHARFVNFLIIFLAYRRGKLITVGYPAIEPFSGKG